MQPKTTAHQTLSSFVLAVSARRPRSRAIATGTATWCTTSRSSTSTTASRSARRSLVATQPAAELAGRRHRPDAARRRFLRVARLPRVRRTRPRQRRCARSPTRRPIAPDAAPRRRRWRPSASHIRERFVYRKNVTRYDSTTDDFLELGAGVCQDFTHLDAGGPSAARAFRAAT